MKDLALPSSARGWREDRVGCRAPRIIGLRRSFFPYTVAWCLGLACTAAAVAPPGIWLNVPYVRQPREGCGAACISMVLEYWVRKDPRFHRTLPTTGAIQRQLYSSKAHGIYARDMEAYLRQQGLRVFAFQGDWNALEEHLSKGRPLIVCLREGRGLDRTLHYVVVAGLDPAKNLVLINDPARRKLAMVHRANFERWWRGEHYWTLLALPRS
jgi:ABC-type bacteriocin/lantibiotic exporter with double-glycine peptidase domain